MRLRPMGLAAVVGATLLAGALPAVAATTAPIRAADLDHSLPVADGANGAATYEFLREGVRVKVDNTTTAYVVLRWKVNQPLSSISKVTFDWIGTSNRPGIKYDVDVTGDGTIDCELQGELNESSVRLNKGTSDFTGSDKKGDANFCKNLAPHVDGSGGTGYPGGDGTFAEWSTKFGAGAKVIDGGISASGLVQDGVLRSVTFGQLTNTFTSDPAAPTTANVSIRSNKPRPRKGASYAIRGLASPAQAGVTVTLQKGFGKKHDDYRAIATTPLLANGQFEFLLKAKKRGNAYYRVVVGTGPGYAGGISNRVKVHTR